ncbi:MAG: N-(5'-phosphoribosyl)anthranilate isomerase [Pyrinomonadaceae bacterium]
MTLVKICGITNLDDAVAAVEAGADALGFNFFQQSPRYIPPLQARNVIENLPPQVLKVGIFVNEQSPEIVRKIAVQSGVRAVQLHGSEGPDYCAELADYYVIKAFAVDNSFSPAVIKSYAVDAMMLDSRDDRLHGGTGRIIDWGVARDIRDTGATVFLAGGLSPENVSEAIAVVRPYAVDSCSLLESEPGKKNPDRMRAFVKAVRGVKP